MFLDYFSLGVLIAVFLILFYGVIIIHDIPYLLAKKRQHPHQDAIHVAGWVSLFTLHAIWPLLWIWATLYRPERGWGMSEKAEHPEVLQARIHQLQSELQRMQMPVADESSSSNKGC
ncbi:TPA: DUF3302 domain-containing protein [Serratia liquefaciens]|jgi:hypothetical protein|nr:DUF3302 domain-containing protein [Serratia liquefaciens]MDU3935918.1 DUF3302 domain-containing protein [Serratia liquefaciens]